MFKKVPGHKLIIQFSHHSRLTKYTRTDIQIYVFEEVDRNAKNSHLVESEFQVGRPS